MQRAAGLPGLPHRALALAAFWPPLSAVRVAYLAGPRFRLRCVARDQRHHPPVPLRMVPAVPGPACARPQRHAGRAGAGRAGGLRRRAPRGGRCSAAAGKSRLSWCSAGSSSPSRGRRSTRRPCLACHPVYGWFDGRPTATIVEVPFWLPTARPVSLLLDVPLAADGQRVQRLPSRLVPAAPRRHENLSRRSVGGGPSVARRRVRGDSRGVLRSSPLRETIGGRALAVADARSHSIRWDVGGEDLSDPQVGESGSSISTVLRTGSGSHAPRGTPRRRRHGAPARPELAAAGAHPDGGGTSVHCRAAWIIGYIRSA